IVPEESLKDINQEEVRRVNLRNREFYCNPKDKFIDVYTELEGLDGFENRYYIKLSDDREVRMNAEYNVHMIIFTTIILTIIANWIIYLLIKKNVVNRILKINNAINEVHEGENSNYSLEDDEKGDEIAELNNDLNAMLRRLRTYSENLEYISRKDTLTELKNRYSINEYILRLTTEGESFSIFFIDLDNFKVINDTLGHNIGDELLLKVSEGLKVMTEKYNNLTVGRLGGDEFIIVRKGENSVEKIKLLAKEILKTVNKSYEFSSYVYEIKASMGISFYPEHSNKGVEVIQYADIAMYCSKRTGGNSYDIFNKSMLEPLKIEKKLKKAIEEEEFEMYLQPIYSINNDKIVGSEALIRWKVDGKIISPDKFIPLAKRTGDIVSIDNFIFETAVKMVKTLLMEGKENFYISINISKLFLKQENLIPFIKQKLREVSIESKYIKMEVAEDEIIDDFDYTVGLLEELRQIGIEIYLDDFGVGYSSFSHIKLLPIDVLKLDRSLLLDIENNKKSQEIVKTLINLAHNLNIEIICEGIETKEQVEILQKLSCDNIQGYFFGKPSEKEKFIEYL
ncbi:MAG: EAL domain-containing protein, partial [Sarcina sp.]